MSLNCNKYSARVAGENNNNTKQDSKSEPSPSSDTVKRSPFGIKVKVQFNVIEIKWRKEKTFNHKPRAKHLITRMCPETMVDGIQPAERKCADKKSHKLWFMKQKPRQKHDPFQWNCLTSECLQSFYYIVVTIKMCAISETRLLGSCDKRVSGDNRKTVCRLECSDMSQLSLNFPDIFCTFRSLARTDSLFSRFYRYLFVIQQVYVCFLLLSSGMKGIAF